MAPSARIHCYATLGNPGICSYDLASHAANPLHFWASEGGHWNHAIAQQVPGNHCSENPRSRASLQGEERVEDRSKPGYIPRRVPEFCCPMRSRRKIMQVLPGRGRQKGHGIFSHALRQTGLRTICCSILFRWETAAATTGCLLPPGKSRPAKYSPRSHHSPAGIPGKRRNRKC